MPLIQKWLPFVDLAILSLSDYPQMDPGHVARELKEFGPQLVLITQGSQGSWLSDGIRLYHQEMISAEVVDTMGAGDAFIAAFVLEYLDGGNIPKAMRIGAEYAAQNCQHAGAFGYGQSY